MRFINFEVNGEINDNTKIDGILISNNKGKLVTASSGIVIANVVIT